jgi:hypothetical protein
VLAVVETSEAALDGEPPSSQKWTQYSRDLMEALAEALPPDSQVGCLCRLRSNVKPMHISDDPEKVNAFIESLLPESSLGLNLILVLLTWPEVAPSFISRLFEKVYSFNKIVPIVDDYLKLMAGMVENMTDARNRKIVALDMLVLLEQFAPKKKSATFNKAVESLRRSAGFASAIPGKKQRESHQEEEPAFIEELKKLFYKSMKKR